MKAHYCQQPSEEWFNLRSGRVTASQVSDALSFVKTGAESKERARYRMRTVVETIQGQPILDEKFISAAMRFGTENEAMARAEYEVEHEAAVDLVGFVVHPTIERSGASPDGLVGDKGGLEIKAPNQTTHMGYVYADVIPPEYVDQMMWNMACCEREWWDFWSYDPRAVRRFRSFHKRLERNDARIAEMERGVLQFLSEVDAMIDVLNRKRPMGEAVQKARLHIDPDLGITDADILRVHPHFVPV